jgi:hypothetical protein
MMTVAYIPFTHLSESTARQLFALVGPPVIYQPLKSRIPESLSALADRGLIDIRTPIDRDDARLRAALAEFTDWARLNPGRSTPGTDFVGALQGQVPFFDETAVSQIRSDIRRYPELGHPADGTDDDFSARLFLALAQDNDRVVDNLDNNLDRFSSLEKEFLEMVGDGDDAGFNRQSFLGASWREDPGARLTGQRIRAWARLAAADHEMPQTLITTSPTVVETLVEIHGQTSGLEKLTDIRLPAPPDAVEPLLRTPLGSLATADSPSMADLAAFNLPTVDASSQAAVTVTLYAAANLIPEAFIAQLGASRSAPLEPGAGQPAARHTLIVLATD